jgi:sugar lactone lactonase YvrE
MPTSTIPPLPPLAPATAVPSSLRLRLGWLLTVPLLALSLVLVVASAYLLWHDITSPVAGWLWALALASLILAFLAAPRPLSLSNDPHDNPMPGPFSDFFSRGVPLLTVRWEVVLVIAMLTLSLVLRLANLDTLPGIFGDEGERGLNARAINEGSRANIFGSGWWDVPNLYFYLVSIMLRVFGDNMAGDRMLSVISGVLTVWFVYKIGRLLWGPRAGLIAGTLLSLSPLALQFSRLAGESTPTATLWAGGFYFLFMALRYRRWSDWALAGTFWGFSLYFYAAGKLIIPISSLAVVYCIIRWASHSIFFKRYALGWLLLATAFLLTFMPYAIFSLQENWRGFLGRAAETSIFSPQNQAQAFGRLAIPYDPTWATQPLLQNILTHLTSWAQLLWGQLGLTLNVLYRYGDPTPFYQIHEHGGSMLQPLWASLTLLGLAYSLWKIRDPRYGLLNIWFWGGLLGPLLTMDTPSVQRLAGAWPALMLFPALLLDRIFASAWPLDLRLARRWALIPISLLLLYFGVASYREYFVNYAALCPYCTGTTQARFAQSLGQDYKAYQFGVDPDDLVLFDYGSTRFAAKGVTGDDMASPSDYFPVTDNDNKGLAFIVYPTNSAYIPLIKLFYPTGDAQPVRGADGNVYFTSIKLPRAALASYQAAHASYKQPSGVIRERDERALGTLGSNPNGLSGTAPWQVPPGLRFPVEASWQSGLVAPTYGFYTFYLTGKNAGLSIDGRAVLSPDPSSDPQRSVSVVLAKGIHDVILTGFMDNPLSPVQLLWVARDGDPAVIDSRFLYVGPNGTTGGLSGEVVEGYDPATFRGPDPLGDRPRLLRRSDPFLGFREATTSFGESPFTVRWQGKLLITRSGPYAFDTVSTGPGLVFIDGTLVVDSTSAPSSGAIELSQGTHDVDIRYAWQSGPARYEWFWTPPGGERAIVPPTALLPLARSWLRTDLPDAPSAQLPPGYGGALASTVTPDAVWGAGVGLSSPRGLAVDASGNIYIGDRGNHRVVVLAPDGKVAATWGKAPTPGNEANPSAGEFNDIVDMAVDKSGSVYVMDTGANQLQLFSPTGTLIRVISREILSSRVVDGIDVGSDGGFYFADPSNSIVKRLSPITGSSQVDPSTGILGASLDQPVDIAVDPTDPTRIYVADLKNRIVQMDTGGNITAQWSLSIGTDVGGSRLAVSPDGALVYVTDPDRKRVAVLTVASGRIQYLASDAAPFKVPSGIAVGPDGRLYVLDLGSNNVQVFPAPK